MLLMISALLYVFFFLEMNFSSLSLDQYLTSA